MLQLSNGAECLLLRPSHTRGGLPPSAARLLEDPGVVKVRGFRVLGFWGFRF